MGRKAVFLDRDGVINIEKGYVFKIEDYEFQAGVFEALRHFASKGYLLFIVTNQSGISRGYYSESDFFNLTDYVESSMEAQGVKIAKTYFCPHSSDDVCECRKPQPGMFFKAQREFDLDMQNSWMIGDKESDIEAALAAGVVNTILVRSGHKIDESATRAGFVVNGVFDTISIID